MNDINIEKLTATDLILAQTPTCLQLYNPKNKCAGEFLIELDCQNYCVTNEYLVLLDFKNTIRVYKFITSEELKADFNLKGLKMKMILEKKFDKIIREIKLEDKIIFIHFRDFRFNAFDLKGNKIFEEAEQVKSFKCGSYPENGISVSKLALECLSTLKVYTNFELKTEIKDIVEAEYYVNLKFFICVIKFAENFCLSIFHNDCLKKELRLEKFRDAEFYFKEESGIILVTSEYVAGNYYGEKLLYFYNLDSNELELIEKEKEQKEQKLKSKIMHEGLDIHAVSFLKNDYAICLGKQPSKIKIYSDKLKLKSTLDTKDNKNRIFYNPQENIQINAGLDNLSGTISIFKKNVLTAKFKRLGASVVEWLSSGNEFIIAITNKLKVDNCFEVMDYYGRVLFKQEFEELVSLKVLRFVETEFVEKVKKPEKLFIEEEKIYKFVPQNRIQQKPIKKEKVIAKKEELTKDEIISKLNEIKVFKIKRDKGEDLNLEEMNLILSEKYLEKKLEKLV